MSKPTPSIELLRDLFVYDDGILRWRRNGQNQWTRAGMVAGQSSKNCNGYSSVRIAGFAYRLHKVIWAHQKGNWPTGDIDHKDRDRGNNRIDNLRPATRSQNLANSCGRSSSHAKGVSFDSRRDLWRARITVNYQEIRLGYFPTEIAAHAAYVVAAEEHFGEFARAA